MRAELRTVAPESLTFALAWIDWAVISPYGKVSD